MTSTIRPLNEGLRMIAQNELNEVDERLTRDIAALKQWIQKQSYLRACIDDQYLLAFLRGSKHSLEKAKSKIDYFYTIKTKMPELFRNMNMNEKFCEFAHAGSYLWVPVPPNVSWPNLSIIRFDSFDFEKFKFVDIMQYRLMVMEHSLKFNDNCNVAGHVEIYDLSKVSLKLYAQANILMLKKLNVFVEKAVPIRFKGIHIINFPKEFSNILKIVKSLIVDKYKNRFHVHNCIEDLYEYVPKERLPVEYGGTNGTVMDIAKYNKEKLMEMNDFFLENDEYGVDERLRPNNIKMNHMDLFGMDGSFRKLDFD